MLRNLDREENNRVTVKIWPSMFSSSAPGTWKSPGHVALQTFRGGPDNQGYYISYWPAAPGRPCPCNGCTKMVDHFHTPDEDTHYKGQAALENTYHLYTLNVDMVNRHFEERIARPLRWSLGGSLFTWRDDHVANCASLTHDCLVNGGLNNIVTRWDRTFLGVKEAIMSKLFLVSVAAIPLAIGTAYVLKNPDCGMSIAISGVFHSGIRLSGNFLSTLAHSMQINEYQDPAVNFAMIKALLGIVVTSGVAITTATLTALTGLVTAVIQGASTVTTNLITFKPSDMQRIMPSARRNDMRRQALLFTQESNREEPAPYKSSWCTIL